MELSVAALRAARRPALPVERVLEILTELFGEDLHAKRVLSLAYATAVLISAGVLGVAAIGKGVAAVRGVDAKHSTKQVDRVLSNLGVDLDTLLPRWVAFLLRDYEEAGMTLDWTAAEANDHTTLVASLQADPGAFHAADVGDNEEVRAGGAEVRARRAPFGAPPRCNPCDGEAFVHRWRSCVREPDDVHGLAGARFVYVLQFRQDVHVTNWDGETRKAAEWQRGTGKLRSMMSASVTVDGHRVGKVVIVRDSGMKEVWCLAASHPDIGPKVIKARYGRRFQTEETVRDFKDPRFGMGLRFCSIGAPARRDKMLLLGVRAQAMLTLLGMAGERCGLDKYLKTKPPRLASTRSCGREDVVRPHPEHARRAASDPDGGVLRGGSGAWHLQAARRG